MRMSRLYIDLLELTEELLVEIQLSNPIYSCSTYIERNSVIEYLSLTIGCSPKSFATYTNEGIIFNVEQLKKVREKITWQKQEILDIENLSIYV
jgi:hypothetical protein